MSPHTIVLPDAESTRALGVSLGRVARAGDVLALEGNLGAGKTTLTQGLAEGLDVPPDHYVNSPTFTILQVHPGRVPLYHIDLYRIADPDEALGLGLEEAVGTDGVASVEWPERLPDLFSVEHLALRLVAHGTGRLATLIPRGAAGARWLEALQR